MRVLFIGQNGSFSTVPLQAIAEDHDIVGIVDSVPQNYIPSIAKIKRVFNWSQEKYTLRSLADKFSVPYSLLQRNAANDLANFVEKLNPDIICVLSMSQLLPEEVFSIPPYGAINLHPALLPRYRGPRPLLWHYYFMESQTGVTVHYIDQGEDTGDIIKQKSIPISLGMRSNELLKEIIFAGTVLMMEALEDISKGVAERTPQKHLPCPFRARRPENNEQLLQWDWPIERVWHFMRGTKQRNQELKSKIPGLSWTVTEFRKGNTDGSSGIFHWSFHGCYLTHNEGEIVILPQWSFKDFLRDWYHLFLKLSGKD